MVWAPRKEKSAPIHFFPAGPMADLSTMAPVSVVVPCWRCQDTIDRAFSSIVGQTWRPAEVILVDDASLDGTLDLLRKLASRHPNGWVRVISLEENGGPGRARNAGWDAAREPYVAFLDADDAWHPRKLELQLQYMLAHPEIDLSGHSTSYLQEPGAIPYLSVPTLADPVKVVPITIPLMLVSNQLPTRSVIVKRAIEMRFRAHQRAEDFLLWLQLLAAKHRCVRMEQTLAYFFRPEFSAGGYSGDISAHHRDELVALRTLYQDGGLSTIAYALASAWARAKYLRRQLIAWSEASHTAKH